MVAREVPLVGQVMPVDYAQMFLDGVQEVLGTNPTMDLFLWCQRVYGAPTDYDWMQPLLTYFHDGTHGKRGRRPLDYGYFVALARGLNTYHPKQTVAALLWRFGKKWWNGTTYLLRARKPQSMLYRLFWGDNNDAARIPNTDFSLAHEFTPRIWSALRDHFPDSYYQPVEHLPSEKFSIALNAFAQILGDQMRIPCDVVTGHSVVAHVSDCPFCGNGLDTCRVWWGVVDSIAAWLDGADPINNDTPYIDIPNSDAHTIALRV